MKLPLFILLSSLVVVTATARAESGGDRTFALMQQNRQAALRATAGEALAAGDFKPYRYGMRLDVADVLDVSWDPGCGVVPVRMRYRDSSGAEQRIEYLEYRAERVSCNRRM